MHKNKFLLQFTHMNQFQIIKELGSGSFGRVLKVVKKQKGSLKQYAIKQIKMNELSAKQKDNAVNQIRLLASIDSPYIIKYKSAFLQEQKNTLCIVMEYADGGDLQGLTKKKMSKNLKFHESFIWQVAHDILTGLKVLHSNQIIHRDIKPANIFFVDGVAKIGDLNVSKVMDGMFAMTQTGTPYYTSPEIWENQRYDYRCDIWSLGCVVYQLCCLRPPFTAKDLPGLSKKVAAGIFDPIPSFYSKKLTAMIKRCLTVQIAKRPTSQQLLKSDVFELLDKNQEGDVQLLETIRCPKVLKMLNRKLPEDQYEPPKKNRTLKFIDEVDPNKVSSIDKSVKSMKRIGSQVFIRPDSRMKIQKQRVMSRQKQNYMRSLKHAPMQVPMQSPKGYVKLPRIPSCKILPS